MTMKLASASNFKQQYGVAVCVSPRDGNSFASGGLFTPGMIANSRVRGLEIKLLNDQEEQMSCKPPITMGGMLREEQSTLKYSVSGIQQ